MSALVKGARKYKEGKPWNQLILFVFCSSQFFSAAQWHVWCVSSPCNWHLGSPTTSNNGELFCLKQGQEAQGQLFVSPDTQTSWHESAFRLMGCSLKPFHESTRPSYVGMSSMCLGKSAKIPVPPENWRLYVLMEAKPHPTGHSPSTQDADQSTFSSTASLDTSVRRTSFIYSKVGRVCFYTFSQAFWELQWLCSIWPRPRKALATLNFFQLW